MKDDMEEGMKLESAKKSGSMSITLEGSVIPVESLGKSMISISKLLREIEKETMKSKAPVLPKDAIEWIVKDIKLEWRKLTFTIIPRQYDIATHAVIDKVSGMDTHYDSNGEPITASTMKHKQSGEAE